MRSQVGTRRFKKYPLTFAGKLALVGGLGLLGFVGFLFSLQNPDQQRLQFYLSRTMTPDITYCQGQKLDFYAPRKKGPERAPLILYIHGGGWLINNKQSDPDQLMRLDPLLDQGYAFASIDYRSLPAYRFPAPVEDALCAVRFLRAKADTFGIDEDRIMVYGNSAGAHLAAMVGVVGNSDTFRTDEYAEYSSSVRGVMTIGGLMDFTREMTRANRVRTAWFAGGYDEKPAYPAAYVSKATPPFLLIHGRQDGSVKYQQAQLMGEALKKNGVWNEVLIVNRADHGLHPEGGTPDPAPDEINKRMRLFVMRQLQ